MVPFSKGFEKAILEKRIRVSLARRLRRRIWLTLQDYDHSLWVQHDPVDPYSVRSTILGELPRQLMKTYGCYGLMAFNDQDEMVPTDLEGLVMGGYPSQVLDVIEFFCDLLHQDSRNKFQSDINEVLAQENCPWHLAQGLFIQVDPSFLAAQLAARAGELMIAQGYHGALDEFMQARNDLSAGDYKGAILNACKSLESALKTATGRDEGTASELIRGFVSMGFLNDLPEKVADGLGERVFGSLPYLRNRLGSHGQGDTVLAVPRSYADLAVHLALALVLFVIQQTQETKARIPAEERTDEPPF